MVSIFFEDLKYQISLFQVVNVRKRQKNNPCHIHFKEKDGTQREVVYEWREEEKE